MSSIKIDSLSPAGLELMQSSESFLTELGDTDDEIYGGKIYSDSRTAITIFSTPPCIAGVITSNIVTNL